MLGSWLDVKNNSEVIRRFSSETCEHLLKKKPSVIVKMEDKERLCQFRVRVLTMLRESVFVVGSCPQLGSWNSASAIELISEAEHEPDRETVWSAVVSVPNTCDIEFRYFVGIVLEPDDERTCSKQIVVRCWETNLDPRILRKDAVMMNADPHTFGVYDGSRMVDRGWLTTETVVQIKLFGDAIQLWKRKLEGRKIQVKLTPLILSRRKSLDVAPVESMLEESMDTQDVAERPDTRPLVEIAVMNEKEWNLRLQEQFGRVFNPDDCIIFNVNVHNPESVGYLMDYYVYSIRMTDGEPPHHVGFSYVLPSMLNASEGQAVVPITSSTHRPIGQLRLDYLVVRPIVGWKCDMSVSYSRIWKKTWQGLDVGHRGLGTSFKMDIAECAEVRENTIASLKNAASAGADLVEFDVQLTKDLVPVIYHDFHVCIAMKRKKQLAEHDMLELPVKDLTLEQLQLLKGISPCGHMSRVLHFCDSDPDVLFCCRGVYHLAEGKLKKERFFDEELEEHQPFPTLRHALECLDPHVGFNVEIKWTMQLKDGTYELYHPFDLNMYLDTVLRVVLEYSGSRKIVFSCFHPDICTMLRLKQNKYPVMFLTQGVTSKYPDYRDPRTQSIPMAVHFASSAEILGINVHTEDILRDTSQVQMVMDAGLIMFCWGDDNNSSATIKHLKQLGIHGIIYDKIDVYSSKEVKESIFLAEAREMQKMLKVTPTPSPLIAHTNGFEIEDAEKAQRLMDQSWQTSEVSVVTKSATGEGSVKSC